MDQRFDLVLDSENLLQSLTLPEMISRPPAGYIWEWRPSAASDSVASYDKDNFQAYLDVRQFKYEENIVEVTEENTISIEGKHEQKSDEHRHI